MREGSEYEHAFCRTRQLIGAEKQLLLQRARVAVFGLGGVGSFAVEALARSGVGQLVLVDFDRVKPSNLNRQLYALHASLGRSKVDCARKRVTQINPACRVTVHETFCDRDSVGKLLDPTPQVVIDALDSLGPKTGLIAAAVSQGTFVVACMGAGARLDPQGVRVADLSESFGCPLARQVRKRLHRMGVYSGVRCVFSHAPVLPSLEPPLIEPATVERGRARLPVGTISYMPALFGLLAASEAIRHLIKT